MMHKTVVVKFIFSFFLFGHFVFGQENEVKIDMAPTMKWLDSPTAYRILIASSNVQRELELAGTQVQNIEKLLREIRSKERKYLKAKRDVKDLEKQTQLRDQLRRDLRKKIGEIKAELLPHQEKKTYSNCFSTSAV